MSYEITGILVKRGNTETKGESFKVREFGIKTTDGQYEQFIKFQCVQDRTSIVDGLNKGDEIKVYFDLRGRMYGEEEKIFTNLNAWRVERLNSAESPAPNPEPKPEPVAATEETSDLPF